MTCCPPRITCVQAVVFVRRPSPASQATRIWVRGNVFANPDLPKPQQTLTQILCGDKLCEPEAVLPLTVALFKTATVRDLGQSNPYFHSGALDTIEDTLRFYVGMSKLARAGKLRNGSPEIAGIHLAPTDIAPLAAFLRSLNEDYH